LLTIAALLLFPSPFSRYTFASNKNENDMETKLNITKWIIVAISAISSVIVAAVALTEIFQFVNSMNYSSLFDWCGSNFLL